MVHRACVSLAALVLAGLLPAAAAAQSASATIMWDRNPEPEVVGYLVEYGTTSQVYPNRVTVGAAPGYQLTGLTPGVTYYFVVRAFTGTGAMSPRSEEVRFSVPNPAKLPTFFTGLVWQHRGNGALALWTMLGSQLQWGGTLGPGAVGDLGWQIVGTGDFNRDGSMDLVWQHNDGRTSAWLMRGQTLLAGQLFNPSSIADTNWRITATADIDRDGGSDIIWRHQVDGSIAVWLMNGLSLRDGHLITPNQVSDLNWRIVGSGDFDGNGHSDLLWRHNTQGDLAVWLMHGDRQVEGRALTPNKVADLGWRIVAVLDVNGDFCSDIVWQHNDGRLALWMMDGTKLAAGAPLNPASVSDTMWKIFGGR